MVNVQPKAFGWSIFLDQQEVLRVEQDPLQPGLFRLKAYSRARGKDNDGQPYDVGLWLTVQAIECPCCRLMEILSRVNPLIFNSRSLIDQEMKRWLKAVSSGKVVLPREIADASSSRPSKDGTKDDTLNWGGNHA